MAVREYFQENDRKNEDETEGAKKNQVNINLHQLALSRDKATIPDSRRANDCIADYKKTKNQVTSEEQSGSHAEYLYI